MVTILEIMIGIIAIVGGIISVLLFMQTLGNFERESTKYLLILEAWSAIVLLLAGYNILFLDIEPWTLTIVMIGLGTLTIATSFVIYDSQKVNYQHI